MPARVVKTVELEPRSGQEAAAAAVGVAATGLRYDEEVTLFTLEELDALAAGAGLQRVAQVGDYAGAPFDRRHSDRWFLVYRRGHDPKEDA